MVMNQMAVSDMLGSVGVQIHFIRLHVGHFV